MTDIVQSAKSVVDTVTGFLTHHVSDLNSVADVLSELVGIAPIDPQDKGRISDVISTVRNSADNITNWLANNNVVPNEVVVKESDLVTAVANFFASDAGKEALANAAKGNANG